MNTIRLRSILLIISCCYCASFSVCQETFIKNKQPAKRKKVSRSQLYEEIADAQATIINQQADSACYGATIQKHAVHIAQKVAHQEYATDCSHKELEDKRNEVKQIEREITLIKNQYAELHQKMIKLCQ